MLKTKTKTKPELKLFDVVELRSDVVEAGERPWGGSMPAGARGTIVDFLADGYFIVEFNQTGQEPEAILTVPGDLLILNWSAPG